MNVSVSQTNRSEMYNADVENLIENCEIQIQNIDENESSIDSFQNQNDDGGDFKILN